MYVDKKKDRKGKKMQRNFLTQEEDGKSKPKTFPFIGKNSTATRRNRDLEHNYIAREISSEEFLYQLYKLYPFSVEAK